MLLLEKTKLKWSEIVWHCFMFYCECFCYCLDYSWMHWMEGFCIPASIGLYCCVPANFPGVVIIHQGKKFLKRASFQVRDGPIKRTETRLGWENSRTAPTTERWRPPLWPPSRDERTQEDYPISAKNGQQMYRVVFLRSLISAWRPVIIYNWCKLYFRACFRFTKSVT